MSPVPMSSSRALLTCSEIKVAVIIVFSFLEADAKGD
jgi:hypothetical protein